MKKILVLFHLLTITFLNAQILDYNDLGVIFTPQEKYGSARFMGMKGAFGALGGDISATSINPAAGAVFTHSMASISLSYTELNKNADFYGTRTDNKREQLNFNQLGGIFVFNNEGNYRSTNKLSFGINYNLLNNFNNAWHVEGIGAPTWQENVFDVNDNNNYTQVENQKYTNQTEGKHSEMNFSIALALESNWQLGISFNSYDLEFIEDATRREIANDSNGHYVDAFESYWQEIQGEGFSFGAGFIYKPFHALRLGLSYFSPVYYDMHEENNSYLEEGTAIVNNYEQVGYYDIIYSDGNKTFENNINKLQVYDFTLKTPSKLTGSIAFIVDNKGLISLDIVKQNYKKLKIYDFDDVNSNFKNIYDDSYTYNLGTEWRVDKISLRGGMSYAKNPEKYAIDSDHLRGYSLGLGINYGNYVLDFAYNHSEQTGYINTHPEFNYVSSTELEKNKNVFLTTLSLKF